MAWDVSGVFRFLDRSINDQYEVINLIIKHTFFIASS